MKQKKRKRTKRKVKTKGITLVLGGGGAKGLAHIGVLEVLEKNKIPIARIIGTSAGALIGGVYAAGKLEKLKKEFLNTSKWEVIKMFFSLPSTDSILNCKKMDIRIKEYTEGIKIEDLKIPFTAVAFNITKGKRALFEKGPLFDAIRSSIAIPGFFKPFQLGESFFVDGGISDILPVNVALEYKADKIVAVNVDTNPLIRTGRLNFLRMFEHSLNVAISQLGRFEEKGADILMRPKTHAGHFDFHKAKEVIEIGRKEAEKALPKIKELLKK